VYPRARRRARPQAERQGPAREQVVRSGSGSPRAHLPGLGRCGAHFVGLNARQLPWTMDGRPASEMTSAHFARHLPELRARAGDPG